MQLFRIISLEKDLWAINEIDKTVMYVINGTERALLLDTGLGLTDLKEEILKLCGEKPLFVVNIFKVFLKFNPNPDNRTVYRHSCT